jgi:hypothetical protein
MPPAAIVYEVAIVAKFTAPEKKGASSSQECLGFQYEPAELLPNVMKAVRDEGCIL